MMKNVIIFLQPIYHRVFVRGICMKKGTRYDQHSVNTAKLSRIIMLIICDAVLLNLSEFLALLIRFEFNITELFTKAPYVENILKFAPV